MARVSRGPRYYPSQNAWVANLSGERVVLVRGPKRSTEQEARERYKLEATKRSSETLGDRTKVAVILNAYLRWASTRIEPPPLSPNSFQIAKLAAETFANFIGSDGPCGELEARDLRKHHFDEWIAAHSQRWYHEVQHRWYCWSPRTAQLYLSNLITAFKWASGEADLITVSPFERRGQKVRHPNIVYRGKRLAISEAEHASIMGLAARRKRHRDFYNLLLLLHGTGARPAEIHRAKASEWNEELQAIVIEPNKAAQGRYKLAYRGKRRVVRIPTSLVPVLKEQMAKYPEGVLFRTERGRPFKSTSLSQRMQRFAKAGGEALRPGLNIYGYRHAYVTRWVKAGHDISRLCELLNTSPAMLHKHYSHLFEEHEALLAALDDFDRADNQTGTASPSPSDAAVLPFGPVAGAG